MSRLSASDVSDLSKALRTVADLLPRLGGGENVSSATKANLPGFAYAQRVTAAWSSAALAMTETYNRSWNEIKAGTYDLGCLMKTWATVYETCSDVAVEAMKGPSSGSGPEWLHFEFNRSNNTNTPETLQNVASLDRKYGQDVVPQATTFERLGAPATEDLALFQRASWNDNLRRDAIRIELDVDKVKYLSPGHYIGFVLAQGVTAKPPLVIVMLRVTA